jgi:hypothetical protein
MPIVINEFEIVVEPQSQGRTPEAKAEPAQPPSPEEITTVMQVYESRLQRVWAD